MYQFKWAFLFIVLNLFVLSNCTTKSSSISEPFDDLLKNYDPRYRPSFGKHAVNVKVSTYITKIYDYQDTDNTVRINFYFRQSWIDPRLNFENTTIPAYITDINLGPDYQKKIWMPDTFMSSNHKTSFVSKDEANMFLIVYRNGTVFTSKRLTAKILCLGSKAWFPFDKKECHLHVESYSMKAKDVLYQWVDDHELIIEKKLIPFKVNPAVKYSQHITLLTGTYSIIGYRINIERFYFNYILSIFLPIILTTILAGNALNVSKRNWSSSSSALISTLFFIAQFGIAILIKLSFNDKLNNTFTALDLFLLINFLFMFLYQFMHLNSETLQKNTNSQRPIHSDTKIMLDESAYSEKNHQFGIFKFGITLIYTLFVVCYLFVCITLAYL